MKKNTLLILCEVAVMAALSFALGMIKLIPMPYGGSITAGEMVPIFIVAFRRGPVWGMACGLASGVMQFVLNGYMIHWASPIFDYFLAFALLGVAGFFIKRGNVAAGAGMALGALLRFSSHLIAGVVFWSSYAGEMNPWLYSFLYNGAYMLPEFAISAVIIIVLRKYANRVFTFGTNW